MNSTALSIKGKKAALGALLLAVAAMAFGLAFTSGAKAASTVGDPVTPEFNYVGLNIGTTVAGEVRELVLKPPTDPIGINGTYTDTAGNFTVPKTGGLDFPPVQVDLDVVKIDGEIGLTKDGSGNYNSDTGVMTMDLSLSLTLGVDDLKALGDELGFPLGTGALKCEFAPLDVALSTAKKWPSTGKAFEGTSDWTDGALAGGWRYTPAAKTVAGDPTVCGMIGGFLQPVGGLWLANSTDPISSMPDGDEKDKPSPPECAETNQVGTYPNCKEPECPKGQVGTYPDCKPEVVAPDKAVISSVKVGKATIKAGKSGKVKITVKNTGKAAFKGKITIKSSSKAVKAPKSVAITVAPGKSATKTITVKTTKKAKGKVTVTAKVGGKTGKAKVTIKKK